MLRLDKCLRGLGNVLSQQFPTSIGAQTTTAAVPASFNTIKVPAVPDFDRCSDQQVPPRKPRSRRPCPSSSRLRSVLRRIAPRAPTRKEPSPSSSRLRSVLRREASRTTRDTRRSQQFPTSIGAQTRRQRGHLRVGRRGPSSSRLRSVLRLNVARLSCSVGMSPSSSRLRSVLRQAPLVVLT